MWADVFPCGQNKGAVWTLSMLTAYKGHDAAMLVKDQICIWTAAAQKRKQEVLNLYARTHLTALPN